MKTQKNLERIVRKTKSTISTAGKATSKFFKDNYRVGVMLSVGVLGAYTVERAYAGSVKVTYSSITLGGDMGYIINKHILGARETLDGYDSSFLESPAPLEIYIHNYVMNEDLSTDSKPLTSITPFAIKLKIDNFVTNADHSLKFKVFNSDGALNHRIPIAYDITDPNNTHIIAKNGDILEVSLPNLINQPVGIYATWIVEMPRIVEGDINEDGKCDFSDYAILAKEWLQTSSATENGGNYLVSDLNVDRITDVNDLMILLNSWLDSE